MPPEVRRPRILFIASGPAAVALTAAGLIERRFPDHRVHLVVLEPLLGELTPEQRQRVAFVVGRDAARFRFLCMARLQPYWMIAVLVAGQPGYLTMKLAGLFLGLGRVTVCYNENGDAFALDRHHVRIVFAHITNRLGARRGHVVQDPLLRGLLEMLVLRKLSVMVLRGLHVMLVLRKLSMLVLRGLHTLVLRGLYMLVGEPVGLCWMLLSIGVGRVHGLLRGRAIMRSLKRLGDASGDFVGVLKDAVDHGDPVRSEDAAGTGVTA